MGQKVLLTCCLLSCCCCLPHPWELYRLSPEDNPDTTQHWGEATNFTCRAAAMELTMSLIRITIFVPQLTRLKKFEKTFRGSLQSRLKKHICTYKYIFLERTNVIVKPPRKQNLLKFERG